MHCPRIIIWALLGCSALVSPLGLALAQTPPERTLIVGTKQAPPFAMKTPDGTWYGISIDLWKAIAEALKLRYELREFDLQGLLDEVTHNRLDLAVAALSITAEREARMDFTHPFYTAGLGIAIARTNKSPWLSFVRTLVSWRFFGTHRRPGTPPLYSGHAVMAV